MEVESCIPPGFRFHPTEEELVGYYLARKVNSKTIDLEIITDIDLYRIEPWDLQVRCKVGNGEQSEWYFFSHKDKKYPTGTRTNRATAAGFWKATGRDKVVLSKDKMIGMRKTLVFYRGRAPNGRKTDWVIHEYRLQTSEHAPPQEEGWVVCRAFKKPSSSNERHNFAYCNSVAYDRRQDHGYFASQEPGLDAFCFNEAMKSHHNPQTIYEQIKKPPLILESSPHEQLCCSPLPTSLIPMDSFNLPRELATDHEANEWKILDDLLQSQLHETVPCLVNSSQPSMSPLLPSEAFLDTQ